MSKLNAPFVFTFTELIPENALLFFCFVFETFLRDSRPLALFVSREFADFSARARWENFATALTSTGMLIPLTLKLTLP